MTGRSPKQVIIVDGHVHIYSCFDLEDLLDAAYRNFRNEVSSHGNTLSFTGILMLAESSGHQYYQQLSEVAERGEKLRGSNKGQWRFLREFDDECSLIAEQDDGHRLVLVSGRQVVTQEGLEVLALATEKMFSNGAPLADLLLEINRNGGIAVIPWGVGKWIGRRAAILSRLFRSSERPEFFLGDNGGRPSFWRNPSHFQLAREIGIRILPGTDPLPLPIEASRVGSFGFMFYSNISAPQSAQNLQRLLIDPNLEIHPYGKLDRTYDFLRKQIRIRMGWRGDVSK